MSDTKKLIQRLRFLASGQDDVHSMAIAEAADALEAMSKQAEMWRSWRERALKAEEENRRLRKDAELLAWALAHPETAAECLEDAAAGDGTARNNLERRIAGLTKAPAIDAAIAKDAK